MVMIIWINHVTGDVRVCLCWQFENAVFSSKIDYIIYSYIIRILHFRCISSRFWHPISRKYALIMPGNCCIFILPVLMHFHATAVPTLTPTLFGISLTLFEPVFRKHIFPVKASQGGVKRLFQENVLPPIQGQLMWDFPVHLFWCIATTEMFITICL